MARSRLNVYLKNQNTTNWIKIQVLKYKICNNIKKPFCTNLLRKTKFDYFRNLNVKDLNDNKKFWKKNQAFLFR